MWSRACSIPLATLACAGCVSDPVTGESRFSLVEWTVEDEIAMGREAAPLVEAQYDGALLDAEARAYLEKLVLEMAELSPRRRDFDFRFELLNSSIPNAFALPGGHVYVTRGLLQELESEAQLISVLGHELGHVEHRHAMLQQSRGVLAGLPSRTIDRVGGIVTVAGIGDRVVGLASGITALPPALYVLSYGRDQELEADRRGAWFAHAMGYDPREATKTFELFQRLEEEAGDMGPLSIFRSHPTNDARIEDMEELIADEYPDVAQRSDFRTGGAAFGAIVERLRAGRPAYARYEAGLSVLEGAQDEEDLARAEALFREALDQRPDEPLFHIAVGEVCLSIGHLDGAATHFDAARLLYAAHPEVRGHWKPSFYLAVLALTVEEHELAVQLAEEAIAVLPTHGVLHFVHGLALEAARERRAAAGAYARVIELEPRGSDLAALARERLRELER